MPRAVCSQGFAHSVYAMARGGIQINHCFCHILVPEPHTFQTQSAEMGLATRLRTPRYNSKLDKRGEPTPDCMASEDIRQAGRFPDDQIMPMREPDTWTRAAKFDKVPPHPMCTPTES